ncbi:MAG: hypothetical protein P8Y70_00140 [Candidatus Lokiarchaeota archaeon]
MNNIHQKTVWVVWLIIIAVMLLFPLQLVVAFEIPFGGAVWALLFTVGGYMGFDQFATIITTKKMKPGFKYTGSYRKLLYITIALWLIVTEALIFQSLLPNIPLPLDNLFFAVGVVSGIFAGGNKMNNAVELEGGME